MASSHKYLDPQVLDKITRLDLQARMIVEGYISGQHRSPYHGFSVEFAQHREYTPGDDLRHLDWKVYGRSNRLYVKEYELETNLRVQILLDTSKSMAYKSEGSSKLEVASLIAASMAYMVLEQQDACGLVTFDREETHFINPSSSKAQRLPILRRLVECRPDKTTDIEKVCFSLAQRINRRGVILLISDLLDDLTKIKKGLGHFVARKQDVAILHVMDQYETTFPFKQMTRFDGLEMDQFEICDPQDIREAYIEEVETFITGLKRACVSMNVDYHMITTDQPMDVALSTWLARRLRTRTKGK